MSRIVLLLLALCLFTSNFAAVAQSETRTSVDAEAPASEPERDKLEGLKFIRKYGKIKMVSLLRLLANPEQFEGRHIAVTGYAVDTFERCALVPIKEFAFPLLRNNAVWLELDKDVAVFDGGKREKYVSLNDKYVTVTGVFTHKNRFYAGTIRNVYGVLVCHPY